METPPRLYFGKLDPSVTEESLSRLFQEQGFNLTNIQLKRGYAFVDCPDQITFDRAIDNFNGFNFMGSVIQVEPSMSKPRGRRNTRVAIHNLPPGQMDRKQIDNIIGTFGTVQRCEHISNDVDHKIIVTYETPEQAETAIDQLNGYEFSDRQLKVEFATNGRLNRAGPRNNGDRPANARTGSGYPLRILVPTDDVGAIIGRGGQTIRGITTDCKVRIDVHRKDTTGMLEKVISIYGTPENCTNACKKIMDIRVKEARENNRGGEIVLKLLADDRFCGRIIGKGGANIRKIKEETNGRVVVSKNYSFAYRTGETSLPTILPDRVVNIRGTVDEMCAAEASVSAILRECYDKEMQAPMQPGDMMVHGMQQMAMMGGPHGGGVYGLPNPSALGMMGPGRGYYGHNTPVYGGQPQMQQQGQAQPVVASTLYVPNSFVGAIIGTGGSNIKKIMRESGAFVSIDTKKETENPAAERTVTIKGSPEANWRACFYIFNKLKLEGHSGYDDVRLRSTIKVPGNMIGRVIGKRGKNVREVQRTTGALVKVPTSNEQAISQGSPPSTPPITQGEEVDVDVFGTFYQIQHAQAKIRSLVGEGLQQQGMPPPPQQQGMFQPQQRRPRGPMPPQP